MIKIVNHDEANKRTLFCNNLRDIINNGPIGPNDVAKKVGVSVCTIYSYMRGKTFPSDDRIAQIASALNVTIDELFDDTYAPWNFGSGE